MKLLIPILFIGCCIYYGCNEDYPLPIIIQDDLSPCEEMGINPVACDFKFRQGKWLEVQDSIDAQYVLADTIWFIEDSLIGWSFQGEPYKIVTSIFRFN